MLGQVTLVVLAALAAGRGYPTGRPYQPSPQLQFLLPPQQQQLLPLLPADAISSDKLKKYTQAGLPLPARGQYVIYYPGGPGSAPVVYALKNGNKAEEGGEEGSGGGYFPFTDLYNFFANLWESTSAKPAEEEATPAPGKGPDPPKLTEGQDASTEAASANLESFDEDDHMEPTSPSPADPKQPEQKLFLLGQPQFFGNYDALKHPEIFKELGAKNPFPSMLLAGNQQPFVWQAKYAPAPPYGSPGKATTEFQKVLAAARIREEEVKKATAVEGSGSSHKRMADRKKAGPDPDTIVVEALKVAPHAASAEEEGDESAEVVGAEPAEPSVAQVRPQAIALAGPSGVAAAAPVGTAVVGRGGLAVAAPAATAVAGPSGGQPPLVVPASRAAQRAYLEARGQARFLERAAQSDDDGDVEYHNYSA